ncbi:hypothetical protein [Paraburkholderia aromaticivorans]|uniref:DUF2474 domain-containing protein n=1 Tax=Paraburkholderia aromaticivorans TaxID=2026199 RepID=A0A248VQ82_9BURK|nr:hypothetical protein [Paraburkholderia aromaticivorans]ASW00672.1 hypothetical protein CJU94_20675 [Paraburkholderia aromaticivorans]
MATNITITEQTNAGASHRAGHRANHGASPAPARKLPGWLWFIALWCFGVGSAVSLGFAFKILMNVTLFAVK